MSPLIKRLRKLFKRKPYLAILFLLIIVGPIIFFGIPRYKNPKARPVQPSKPEFPLEIELGSIVQATLNRKIASPSIVAPNSLFNTMKQPVFLQLRQEGIKVADLWQQGGTWKENIIAGLSYLLETKKGSFDTIIIELVTDFKTVTNKNMRGLFSNIHRGVYGLSLSFEDKQLITPATQFIARNLSLWQETEFFKSRNGIQLSDFPRISAKVFSSEQYHIHTRDPLRVTKLFRANQVIDPKEVTRANTEKLAAGLSNWLANQTLESGRIIYQYFPSQGKETFSNNMIRQFLGTSAMINYAKFKNDRNLLDLAEKNIRYNLSHFYKTRGDLGLISYSDKAKLGAAALAALSFTQHPKRELFEEQVKGLSKLVLHLWQEDGSFRTFLYPPDRNDNQNFYPGEALVFWAALLGESQDPTLLEKFMKSFEYYREWHLENRNPAFVPWHTQAYYTVWKITKNEELKDYIFLMNDWLIKTMQQWEALPYPDARGRFHNPIKPYGPPHVSSTGVYLEGLIDAFALARAVHDSKREDFYREAIRRALRSIMQLQFADDIDAFYISKKKRVMGGLRTTLYDNTLRVDNVGHNLLAMVKILKTFEAEDFYPS